MEIRKANRRADHPWTLTSIGNLALTYQEQSRYKDAETLQAQVIETRKTKLGPNHPNTLLGISNLTLTYIK
jgi:hypothetical protein